MFKFANLPDVLVYMKFELSEFVIYDDNNGKGPYIKEWLSDKPEPTKRQIESAYKKMEKEKEDQ